MVRSRDYNATTTPGVFPTAPANGKNVWAGHGVNRGPSATPEIDGLGLLIPSS
jgi:hypothetical protein